MKRILPWSRAYYPSKLSFRSISRQGITCARQCIWALSRTLVVFAGICIQGQHLDPALPHEDSFSLPQHHDSLGSFQNNQDKNSILLVISFFVDFSQCYWSDKVHRQNCYKINHSCNLFQSWSTTNCFILKLSLEYLAYHSCTEHLH